MMYDQRCTSCDDGRAAMPYAIMMGSRRALSGSSGSRGDITNKGGVEGWSIKLGDGRRIKAMLHTMGLVV